MHTDLEQRIESLLAPAAADHGLEFVAVEIVGARPQPTLRVYLDQDGGIALDTICEANRWISPLIDDLDPFDSPYTLEVSSPGVDRPLRTREDYARFMGSTATLRTKRIDDRTRFTGVIIGVQEAQVLLDIDGQTVPIALEDVRSARLKGSVDYGRGKDGCEHDL
ncbi:MAG TPA: ribosome maturation factor RimP [Coriobacteriia bacterium]|nr:ribosome maturation factor RimP [Coriobacteriia bacterium]